MALKDYLALWLACLVVLIATAANFSHPGYMDAFYYYHVAANIAQGRGLVEDFVWNYLPPPESVVHPSNAYWMPLTSAAAAPFMALFGASFQAAQAPLILISSMAPVLTSAMVWRWWRSRPYALWSAALTLFSGFYLVHWVDIDSFGLYALFAGATLFIVGELAKQSLSTRVPALLIEGVLRREAISINGAHGQRKGLLSAQWLRSPFQGRFSGSGLPPTVSPQTVSFGGLPAAAVVGLSSRHLGLAAGSGLLIAAAHLTRADGILLLPVLGVVLMLTTTWRRSALLFLIALAAYLLAMAPWTLRNLSVMGSPLPVGGAASIFSRGYSDLFSYGEELSVGFLLQAGAWPIVVDRVAALAKNLVVLYGGAFYLVPFGVVGAWSWRRDPRLLAVVVYALLLYLTFSLVFPHPGVRGGIKHSGVALLPWASVLAVHGIYTVVAWVGARRTSWSIGRAQFTFTAIAMLFSGALAVYITVYERDARDEYLKHYIDIQGWLQDNAPEKGPVMVTNPPAYAYVGDRPSIATPTNGLGPLLAAADRYNVSVLALELDHARALDPLYNGETGSPRLQKVADVGTTQMYRIVPERPARLGQ